MQTKSNTVVAWTVIHDGFELFNPFFESVLAPEWIFGADTDIKGVGKVNG